ncbi:ATP-binding protein [Streptomyces xantholiticus]|uniref:ATP-binding protein n=1 Tax=Streptomyces xantholiticus TaxID=68285 RepID=A0ABV1UUA6_9ACTN
MWRAQRESGPVNRDALASELLDPRAGTDLTRYAFELPARVEHVSRARKLVSARLAGWGVDGDPHDTALLVVSELFTNAIVHTDGHLVACRLHAGTERLRITVQDQGCAATGPRVCHGAQGERGRGLLLVEAVSCAWGTYDAAPGTGRAVWAELTCTPRLALGNGPPAREWPC